MTFYLNSVLFALTASTICFLTLTIGERALHRQDIIQQEELRRHVN